MVTKIMKYVLTFWIFLICCEGNSQTSDSIINCNDKWLEELVKTDSLSKENRKQDFLCFFKIFDSLDNSKLYSNFQLLHAIGNLSKYSDGAFSEGLFYKSFEYLFANPDSFFTIMKKEKKVGMKKWAMMIYYEYAIRVPMEMNFSIFIIEELELKLKNKKIKGWKLFQKVLKEVDKEHQKQFEEYYKK